jgi:hypothetical protein
VPRAGRECGSAEGRDGEADCGVPVGAARSGGRSVATVVCLLNARWSDRYPDGTGGTGLTVSVRDNRFRGGPSARCYRPTGSCARMTRPCQCDLASRSTSTDRRHRFKQIVVSFGPDVGALFPLFPRADYPATSSQRIARPPCGVVPFTLSFQRAAWDQPPPL